MNKDVKWLRKCYVPFLNLNGWALGHFASYASKGIIFGNSGWMPFFIAGASFELFECFLEYYVRVPFVDSAVIKDTTVNMCGYTLGVMIRDSILCACTIR